MNSCDSEKASLGGPPHFHECPFPRAAPGSHGEINEGKNILLDLAGEVMCNVTMREYAQSVL